MLKSYSIRTKQREELSLNLTPLIDVVFLLLIFFMVTTTFKQAEQLGIELPQTKTTHTAISSSGFELGIGPKGDYVVEGVSIGTSLNALEEVLRAKAQPSEPLLLVGDKIAPHQSVVSAMDVASKLGITRIKIITEHDE